MNNPEKNIPRVLVAVMTSVTILDCLMLLVAIGLSGQKLGSYSNPLASALKLAWSMGLCLYDLAC